METKHGFRVITSESHYLPSYVVANTSTYKQIIELKFCSKL